MKKRMRERGSSLAGSLAAGGLVAVAVLSVAAVAWAVDYLFVVQRETSIRTGRSSIAKVVMKVRETNKLTKLGEEGSWYQVEYEGKQGWIPKTAVSDDEDTVFSGEALAQGVQVSNSGEAGRGFNPEVEKKYRADRPRLNEVYPILDGIEKRVFPDDEIRRFLAEGRLGAPGVADAGVGPAPAAPAAALAAPSSSTPGTGRATPPWKN